MMRLLKGADADRYLRSPETREQWRRLWNTCEWSSPFQHPDFVLTWLDVYGRTGDPVAIIREFEAGVDFLLLLWKPSGSNSIRALGTHQAEYQDWLGFAMTYESDFFDAIDLLSTHYKGMRLTLRYLAAPMACALLDGFPRRGIHANAEIASRPIMPLEDQSELEKSLSKKGNKSKLSRLRRVGRVVYRRLTADEVAERFRDVATAVDFRQAGTHGSLPFRDDPLKARFHLELAAKLDIPHVSALFVGEAIASFQFALRAKDEVILWLVAHSAPFANQSPGKLHLLQLGIELGKAGYLRYDLTPGGDGWKERFAEAARPAVALSLQIGATRNEYRRQRIIESSKKTVISTLKRLGVTASRIGTARRYISKFTVDNIARNLKYRAWHDSELIIYSREASISASRPEGHNVKINDIHALLLFDPDVSGWPLRKFLESSLRRIEAGEHCYTISDDRTLLHYGWLAAGQARAYMSEVEDYLSYPPHSAVLYDFFTHPSTRGRGMYRSSLQAMLGDIAMSGRFRRALITVRADNLPSRKVIEALRFEPRIHMFNRRRLGMRWNWTTGDWRPAELLA